MTKYGEPAAVTGGNRPWAGVILLLALLGLAGAPASPPPVLAAPAVPRSLVSLSPALSVPVGVPVAGVPAAPPPARPPGFRWPLDGTPPVIRRFDPPPRPWLSGHRGVDLAAVPGSTVRVAGSGVVLFAGRIAGRGVVSVSHPGGLRTTYEPVEATVAVGDRVSTGDPIGMLVAGHDGCPAPACLHWGLRRGEAYLDPLSLLGFGRVRLLPN